MSAEILNVFVLNTIRTSNGRTAFVDRTAGLIVRGVSVQTQQYKVRWNAVTFFFLIIVLLQLADTVHYL